MTNFVSSLGEFFGVTVGEQFCHRNIRYAPQLRMTNDCQEAGVREVVEMLSDEASRSDFIATISAKPTTLWKHWWRDLYNGVQYSDYVSIDAGDTILNCGVHGGFEIQYFIAALGIAGRIVNIDPLGHDYLLAPVKAFVEQLSLQRTDLIKMDIEGAELRALMGVLESLESFRPNLASSIYHEPDHFVNIPLLLRRRLHDYDFFVRSYHFIANEAILYGIPKERPRRERNQSIIVELVE